MKSLSYSAVLLFSLLISQFSFAQSAVKKETIKVWGNCGMCKKNIEKAARSAGAATANWNEDSKQLKVSYSSKTSTEKIQEAIANVGYDTQDFTADNKAYDNLHGCCQYERKDAVAAMEEHKCCSSKECKKDSAACKEMACCKDEAGKEKEKACCKM